MSECWHIYNYGLKQPLCKPFLQECIGESIGEYIEGKISEAYDVQIYKNDALT